MLGLRFLTKSIKTMFGFKELNVLHKFLFEIQCKSDPVVSRTPRDIPEQKDVRILIEGMGNCGATFVANKMYRSSCGF